MPLAHRETPFDLTDAEWIATRELLLRAKAAIDERFSPDGYTLIWNCYPVGGQATPHAHFHVIPRFSDEPYAGRGGRWLIKQPENRRPDPKRRGQGLAHQSLNLIGDRSLNVGAPSAFNFPVVCAVTPRPRRPVPDPKSDER